MRKTTILLAVVAVAFGGCSRSSEEEPSTQERTQTKSDYERGKADARSDLEAGRPRYFYVGQPLSADSRIRETLKRDYNITLVELGCVPVPPVGDHAKGYNEVISEVLGQQFGQDFIRKAFDRDQKLRDEAFEKRH